MHIDEIFPPGEISTWLSRANTMGIGAFPPCVPGHRQLSYWKRYAGLFWFQNKLGQGIHLLTIRVSNGQLKKPTPDITYVTHCFITLFDEDLCARRSYQGHRQIIISHNNSGLQSLVLVLHTFFMHTCPHMYPGTFWKVIQWNLSVTTTSMIKFVSSDLFSNVF